MEKNNDLTEKNHDLKKMHDDKTELSAKLMIKSFIFCSEVRRLNGVKK